MQNGDILKVYHKGRLGVYFFGIILEIEELRIKVLSFKDHKIYHFGKNIIYFWMKLNEAEILK